MHLNVQVIKQLTKEETDVVLPKIAPNLVAVMNHEDSKVRKVGAFSFN